MPPRDRRVAANCAQATFQHRGHLLIIIDHMSKTDSDSIRASTRTEYSTHKCSVLLLLPMIRFESLVQLRLSGL